MDIRYSTITEKKSKTSGYFNKNKKKSSKSFPYPYYK